MNFWFTIPDRNREKIIEKFIQKEQKVNKNKLKSSFECCCILLRKKISNSSSCRCKTIIILNTFFSALEFLEFAERKCSVEGQWEPKPGSIQPNGWTNYTPCYTPEMLELMKKLYSGGSENLANIKIDIAEKTRTLEMIGFSLSLTMLVISLIIFCRFRSLRNNRTRIHKNLFIAMIIQVLIRLTVYLDQAIIRSGGQENGKLDNPVRHGIDNTPFLCEGSYVLLEYARTAMFMWMFIEGLYLHNVVTVTVFQGKFPHRLYAILGWGGPVIMTAVWAGFTAAYVGNRQKCWWGYNLTSYYWILEGPRLGVILLNFCFLLNIIRVLIVKLRQSHTSDVEQVRKAVRAALVLLPLLGITNLLNMAEAPLDRTAWEFALWSYTTHFLTSFQGFFIAMLYCFLNGEVKIDYEYLVESRSNRRFQKVRAALLKSLSVYMSLRGNPSWLPRRPSMFSAAYATAPVTEAPACYSDDKNRSERSRRKYRSWLNFCFHMGEQKKTTAENAPPESVNFDVSDE